MKAWQFGLIGLGVWAMGAAIVNAIYLTPLTMLATFYVGLACVTAGCWRCAVDA